MLVNSLPFYYSDVMTLSALRQNIYSSLYVSESTASDSNIKMEAMFNLIQATFVTLQSSPSLSVDEETLLKGQRTFHTLFTRYFKETMEV